MVLLIGEESSSKTWDIRYPCLRGYCSTHQFIVYSIYYSKFLHIFFHRYAICLDSQS
ncbi:hypothetical protein RchiOBHm_Chr7g0243291 [Rosa chinensis]|uniref:Uncharacterized protein n=1 Tax=Rosa chinensis TaxID=74649 RepID=A0A2P6PIP9_ROSCH|nr:hypothetical protein RchiOBHm_Chr7g0243291 [Rosa chinensis]